MEPNAGRTTANERAQAAFKQMKQRQSSAASERRGRERWRHVKWAVAATVVIVVLAVVAVQRDWIPESQRSTVQSSMVDKFGETRAGQVRRHVSGNTCHELVFDNASGRYTKGVVVPCRAEDGSEPNPGQVPRAAGQRLNAIRDAFAPR